jgi:hypothetical protein
MRSARIMIAPNDIAGFYGKLQKGLLELGYSVIFANFYAKQSGYQFDQSTWKLVTKSQVSLAKSRTRNNTSATGLHLSTILLYYFYSLLTLIYSLRRIDTYIFVYGRSFLPWNLDLPILRILGKKTISVVGHGNEARPPYLSYNGISDDSEELSQSLVHNMYQLTQSMKKKLTRIEKHSTYVIGSSCTCQLMTKQFIDIAALRQPVAISESVKDSRERGNSVKILHSPSDPTVKGSLRLKKIIEELKDIHPNIEFIEITGVSNSEVLDTISSVDLIIDQLWSDSPMTMIMYEAASLGKPSITFGAALPTLQLLDKQIPLPIYGYFPIEQIRETITLFATDKNERDKLAELQRKFVCQNATIEAVAENFDKIISDTIPNNWIVDPNDCEYTGGCGLPPEVSLKQMTAMSDHYGVASLQWVNASYILNKK